MYSFIFWINSGLAFFLFFCLSLSIILVWKSQKKGPIYYIGILITVTFFILVIFALYFIKSFFGGLIVVIVASFINIVILFNLEEGITNIKGQYIGEKSEVSRYDIEGLVNSLNSSYGFQRANALDELVSKVERGLINSTAAAQMAVPLFSNDSDDAVREAAIYVLEHDLDNANTRKEMVESLMKDPAMRVQLSILKVFGSWWGISRKEHTIAIAIAHAAFHSQHETVREKAINELKGMLLFNPKSEPEGKEIRKKIRKITGEAFLAQLEEEVSIEAEQ